MRRLIVEHGKRGYRGAFHSDEEETLIAFSGWLRTQGIAFRHNVAAIPETYVFTILTEWITDKSKAVLLKMTWG